MKTRVIIKLTVALALILVAETAMGAGRYGYGPSFGAPPPWASPPWTMRARGMRVERSSDQDHYYVILHLSGIEPQGVTVTPIAGRWLRINTQKRYAAHYEDIASNRTARHQGFSYRSSDMSRRIGLPQDADVSALQRENGKAQVKMTIPRQR